MKLFIKSVLSLTLLLMLVISCSKVDNQSSKLQPAPKYYDAETLAKYNDITNAGYNFLQEGNLDSAVASFQTAGTIIPEAKYVEYNLACSYGRTGDKDKAFEWLNKMADKGWDIPDQLYQDTDLSSLVDDPRFDEIIAKCEKNRDENEATIVNRIPELATAPKKFTSKDEMNEWIDSSYAVVRKHNSIWYASQYTKERIAFSAKKLACMKEFYKNDSTVEFPLTRLYEAFSIKSPYDCWGKNSELVINECDAYLAGTPSDSGSAKANFYAGFAYSNQNCDKDDMERTALLEKSNTYLMKVPETAKLYGPAQTLILANKLDLAGEDKEQYREDVRATLTKYSGDNWVNRIVSTRFFDDAIAMLWPIEIGLPDLNNKLVKLDDYKGKVLLIDFWATWCGPCLAELPNVKNVYKEYHDKGFDIVSVSLDYEDRKPLDAYKEWITENEMPWRHIYEGKGWDVSLVQKYFVSGIPAPFMIGKDGQIFAQGEDCAGPKLTETLEKALAM